MNIDTMQTLALAISATLAALGIIWLRLRSTGVKLRRFWSKIDSAMDTLNGRGEILHPDTGSVLVEATPGLGVRLAHIEFAIVSLSETHAALKNLTVRVDSIDTRLTDHLTDTDTAREEASEMWRAIAAVAEAEPPVVPKESV